MGKAELHVCISNMVIITMVGKYKSVLMHILGRRELQIINRQRYLQAQCMKTLECEYSASAKAERLLRIGYLCVVFPTQVCS